MKTAAAILLSMLMLTACTPFNYSGKGNDVPTAGELEIWVDHGDSFLMSQIEAIYESQYPKADLHFRYASELDILEAVNNGTCRACILHRDFDTAERTALEGRDFKVRSVKIARTSTALIAHPQYGSDQIRLNDLKKLLSGESRTADARDGSEKVSLVFDQAGGSNYLNLLRKFFGGKQPAAKSVAALGSPLQVLEWVAAHSNTIGFVNVNLLSDRGDTMAARLAGEVKVLKLEGDSLPGFHYPFQSQMAARQYPLVMDVYLHDLQGYSGLASGLAAWMYSQPGQVLVKKSGLLPAKDYGRTIELGSE